MSQHTPSTPHLANLDRRGLLAAGLIGTATLAATVARAEDPHAHHGGAHDAAHAAAAKFQTLVDAAQKCVARGEVCVAHCIALLAGGDTSLKDCLRAVQIMMPMCATLARAGALETPRLKDIAKVCLDICQDCERECKKHAEHHAACKACMESCADCIAECKKVI